IRYDLSVDNAGAVHPLLGRRCPDLELLTAVGPRRLFAYLHRAEGMLLNLSRPLDFDLAPWRDRVQQVEAKYEGAWQLPVLGVVDAPSALLVRPDGYVAWVGNGNDLGLRGALTAWFGEPGNSAIQSSFEARVMTPR